MPAPFPIKPLLDLQYFWSRIRLCSFSPQISFCLSQFISSPYKRRISRFANSSRKFPVIHLSMFSNATDLGFHEPRKGRSTSHRSLNLFEDVEKAHFLHFP